MNSPATQPKSLGAEALAATLPPLMIAAERVAATVAQGIHGRRQVGSGHSFWQFRPYLPGDSTSRIDWRETGKSQRAYIREHEWDAAQSVWLWLDRSQSMQWRSANNLPLKAERAQILTLATAALLLRAGERVALLGSGAAPAIGRAVLSRMSKEIESVDQASLAPLSGLPAAQTLPRHASLILFGDFLDPVERIVDAMNPFIQRGIKGHLMQIMDPAEEDLPYEGRVRFEGLEHEGAVLMSRTEAIRNDYRHNLATHRAALRTFASNAGWSFAIHRTSRAPQTALLSLWALLSGNLPSGNLVSAAGTTG